MPGMQIQLLDHLHADDPHEAARAAICLRSMPGETIPALDVDALIGQFETTQDEEFPGRGHLALLLGEKGCEKGKEKVIKVLERYLGRNHVGYLCALALDILGYWNRAALEEYLMVRVPAGEFTMGGRGFRAERRHPVRTRAYLIDRFPLTVGQYRPFVDGGGYEESGRCWWSDEGWAWKEREGITEPLYWHDPGCNLLSVSVVGISYYEAETYAKWARKRLPTEEEWERAARGDGDAREYPWGDAFDATKCNANLIDQLPPVGSYPGGVSPHGCCDMLGNVEEWTASLYESREYWRVLRGKSWAAPSDRGRCSSRDMLAPGFRYYEIGVRFSRAL